MHHSNPQDTRVDVTRRDFLLKGTSLAALMGGIPIYAQEKPKTEEAPTEYRTYGPPVNCAVIGCGVWGREIIKSLALLPNAPVVAVCDSYAAMLKRAADSAPKAEKYAEYQKVMENKDVKAVFVATPSHQHKDIVVAALQAGKHVYCEAPLASSLEDARAIALAAKAAKKVNFQSGLQWRCDYQRQFQLSFIRAGAMGKTVMGRGQWHKKQSWRRPAPSPEREQALNWRLDNATSGGMIAEQSIHQIDMAGMVFGGVPTAVTGFGGILHWKDGRTVPDTIQTVIEYPSGSNMMLDATLGNSFDTEYEVYFGTDAAVMMRENKAWMFKETDAPLLGWEVYARKDSFYRETGIALLAGASKQANMQDKVSESIIAPKETAHYFALETFIANTNLVSAGVEDFTAAYGDDDKELATYIADLNKKRMTAAGYKEGFEATVVALKAHEATLKHERIVLKPEWFQLG